MRHKASLSLGLGGSISLNGAELVQITYVGRLTVTGNSAIGRRGFTYTYEWDRDPAREAEALTIIADRYKKSPWLPLLQNRLTALPPRP